MMVRPGARDLGAPLLVVLVVIASLLLVAAEAAVQREVIIGAFVAESERGGERHLFALLVPALLAPALAWGAAFGRSRPAALAVAALALVAVAVVLVVDLPGLTDPGRVSLLYTDVRVDVGSSVALEAAGAALMLAAAVGLVKRTRPRAEPVLATASA